MIKLIEITITAATSATSATTATGKMSLLGALDYPQAAIFDT